MPSLTKLSIITPSTVKFSGDAEIVVAPGAAGDLGALPNHAPLLMTLRTGVVRATVRSEGAAQSERVEFAVDRGFMQVLPDKVVILTDLALSAQEVDVEAARADLRRAQEAQVQKRGSDDAQERAAIAWAQARLEVAKRT